MCQLYKGLEAAGDLTMLDFKHASHSRSSSQVNLLLTTGSFKAYSLLKDALPARVTVQLVPMDTPLNIALFMRKWQPQVGIVMVRSRPFSGRGHFYDSN